MGRIVQEGISRIGDAYVIQTVDLWGHYCIYDTNDIGVDKNWSSSPLFNSPIGTHLRLRGQDSVKIDFFFFFFFSK